MEFGNGFDSGHKAEIVVPQTEIYRYLGYRRNDPDDTVKERVAAVCRQLEGDAQPQAFFRDYPLTANADGMLIIDGMQIRSRGLFKNMSGCERVILLAATLGAQVDRWLYRLGRLDVTGQVILQAAAAAYLEAYLDWIQDHLRQEGKKQGWYIRPRFSPGYGDLGLEYQKWMAQELQLQKRLGIVLSDSLMMSPSKSVTALIGVSRSDIRCLHNGCETCVKTDCAFRRQP